MNTKSRTTGFGSFIVDIKLVVNQPHDKLLIDAGWVVFQKSDYTTIFEYSCRNRYRGDDETVVYTLYGDLPKALDNNQFHIDWDNSVY